MKAERVDRDIPDAVVQFSHLLGLHQVPDVNAAVLGSGEDASVGVIENGLDAVAGLVLVADVLLQKLAGGFVEKSDGFAGCEADEDALPVPREGHRGHGLGADQI